MFSTKMFNSKKVMAFALSLSALTNIFGMSDGTSYQAEAAYTSHKAPEGLFRKNTACLASLQRHSSRSHP